MHPLKKITKVLTETGVKKLAEYVDKKRDDYEEALLRIHTTLPALAKGSTSSADKWKSANHPHTIGKMNSFAAVYRGCESSSSVLRPHHSITGSGMGTDANLFRRLLPIYRMISSSRIHSCPVT